MYVAKKCCKFCYLCESIYVTSTADDGDGDVLSLDEEWLFDYSVVMTIIGSYSRIYPHNNSSYVYILVVTVWNNDDNNDIT